MDDFRTQIPQAAFINAQVIQSAISDGDLGRSLREIAAHYNFPHWPMMNPAYVASLLYCLIVVPKEIWDPQSNDRIYKLLEKNDPLGLFQTKKWTPRPNEHPIRDFIRHLRNAISHVRFAVDSDRNFEFWDKNNKGVETFRAFITLDNLAKFLSTVGSELANLRSR